MGRRHRRNTKRRPRRREVFDLDELFDLDDFFERRDYDWEDWPVFRRRVVIDNSKKPDTGFPIALGLAALIAAMMLGGGLFLPLVALIVIGVAGGTLLSRVFSGFKKLAGRVFRRFFESHQARQERLLEELHKKLRGDNDPRTHKLLRALSQLYKSLEKDIKEGNLTYAAREVLESVDEVFKVCVEHLERSYALWEMARVGDYASKRMLEEREHLISEVETSVEHLEGVVSKLHERELNRDKSELKSLRNELDETLRVAQRVEERTEELDDVDGQYELPKMAE
jgi:hypothetical protein